jgi:type I restriction enzyme S subunit
VIRYVDIASVSESEGIDLEALRPIEFGQAPGRARRLIRTGDVLLSTVRPNLRAFTLVPRALDGEVASTGFAVLRAGDEVEPGYVWCIVRSDPFVDAMVARCTGSNYPAIRPDDIASFEIDLPSLQEQRRIMDLIGTLDDHVATLDVEAQSLGRLSQASLDHFVRQAMTSGPMTPLSDLLAAPATYGVLKPGEDDDAGVPLIRGQDIQRGGVALTGLKRITPALDEEYRRSRVETNDVVVVLVGNPGASGLVPSALRGANISRAVGRLRCGDMLVPEYLLAVLSSPWGLSLLGAEVRGAVQQMINLKELRAIKIPVPDPDTQVRLASDGLAASRLRSRVQNERDATRAMRGSILGTLLSGDAEIPESYDDLLEAV